jgi:alkanesulfonate monooxygenase SsuD/methylene tetrahydromethanopterin reductase-like flavin-dependent oxidoreductase (luciferase family)
MGQLPIQMWTGGRGRLYTGQESADAHEVYISDILIASSTKEPGLATSDRLPVGLVLGSAVAPEEIRDVARLAEEQGLGELWLAEDYFYTGGIAAAAAALEATQEIAVGTGIMSALVRHPALLAMEVATLCRMHPGRFWPGIGLGTPHWVRQMHLYPKSQIAAVRECTDAVRRLLAGETLTQESPYFGFDDVTLTYPPREVPPLYLGVLGPKMLTLSGEIADGTVTSIFSNVPYLRWLRERIAQGQAAAGRTNHHRVAAFALFCCDDDGDVARDALRPLFAQYLTMMPRTPMSDRYGISDELAALAAEGPEAMAAGLRPDWVSDLAVVGNPEECAAQIQTLLDAGADSVVLSPMPTERGTEMARKAGTDVLPRLVAA